MLMGSVPEGTWVSASNVADIVRRSAAQYGERIAIISAIENVTFAELHDNVNQYARALLGYGVKRGDFVGLLFKNSIDFFRAYFGCARVGATAVPLNPNLKSSDYEYIVEETRIRLLIVHGDLLPVAVDMQRAAPAIDLVVSSTSSDGSTPEDLLGAMKWSEFVGLGTSSGVYLSDVEVMVDDRDSAQCIYTSGTQATAHGWFHSGDLGFLDDAGTVHFVDRMKDMIKTGGENVASMEVAQAIMLHPCVAECAVVGIPHPRWSEAITAFVKTQANELTEAELLAHCRDKLAPFKVPKRILFVDEFPRTASRKIRNVDLREQYRMIYQ
jgi:acyl-CoA synthetase (AMP-forming)/AMP-acid ligase II